MIYIAAHRILSNIKIRVHFSRRHSTLHRVSLEMTVHEDLRRSAKNMTDLNTHINPFIPEFQNGDSD